VGSCGKGKKGDLRGEMRKNTRQPIKKGGARFLKWFGAYRKEKKKGEKVYSKASNISWDPLSNGGKRNWLGSTLEGSS